MTTGTIDLAAWTAPRAHAEKVRLTRGERTRIVVELAIPDGCHIQAHEPADPFLIPTVLTVDGGDGIEVHDITYPPEETHGFEWSPVVLAVYRGTIHIVASVGATAAARPGRRQVAGRIRYQGCTENACLPPAEHGFQVLLDVE